MALFESPNNTQNPLPRPAAPPTNLPVTPAVPAASAAVPKSEPEDIFKESAPVVPTPRPAMPAMVPRPAPASPSSGTIPRTPEAVAAIAETPARGFGKKMVRLLAFALGGAVIVIAGYFLYQFIFQKPAEQPLVNTPPATNADTNTSTSVTNTPPVNETTNANTESNTNAANANTSVPVVVPNVVDSDQDGLSDTEEMTVYRTNPTSADTDQDGLTDRDEVVTWKTDPNNPDSDGDGYKDGDEVKNGYDPKGPGKLLPSIPSN